MRLLLFLTNAFCILGAMEPPPPYQQPPSFEESILATDHDPSFLESRNFATCAIPSITYTDIKGQAQTIPVPLDDSYESSKESIHAFVLMVTTNPPINQHNPEFPIHCFELNCKKRRGGFGSGKNLFSHLSDFHKKEKDELKLLYPCPYCEKKITYLSTLWFHVLMNHPEIIVEKS